MKVINIAFLGHKDHGKSTLIGNLLMQTDSVTQARVDEAKAYSKKLHKGFEPAFILDSFIEEREDEMTYDTTRAEIKYKGIAFNFIDVPGHEELIKNMISGASYADFAVVLVSAKDGDGIKDQTKRHIFLAKMMGIKRIIIAVNKIDTISHNEAKFNHIASELSSFLENIGFGKSDINFIPISAYFADNLAKISKKTGWYKGDSLLDILYWMAKGKKAVSSEKLRVIVQGLIDDNGKIRTIGKVISGSLKSGEKVKIIPSGMECSVKELIVKGKSSKIACKGENIAVTFDNKSGRNLRGSVIIRKSDSMHATGRINTIIFFTERVGRRVTVRFNGLEIKASLKISQNIDVATGNPISDKTAHPLQAANAVLELDDKMPAEPFEKTPELGRFVVYNKGRFSGIGIINSVGKR